MTTITKLGFAGSFALAVWACGGSASNDGTATTSAAESDLTTFQGLAAGAQTAATSYGMSMMMSGSATACQGIHDGYDAKVRPSIAQMTQMAGEMDDLMDAHGGMSSADMACVAAAMMAELDRHQMVACTFADVASDRSEAARHVGAMLSFGGHMSQRCGEMRRGMDGGSWSWGSMMGACGR